MHAFPPLEERFTRRLGVLGVGEGSHVLVAVSGGCDSIVLLHLLLGIDPERRPRLTVAHLDHAMRPDSAADAAWIRERCEALGVDLVRERLAEPPRSEAAARDARYAFLHAAARRAGADLIATAHTADDQAETVLFRAVRGTGLRGLAGIRARTPAGVVRPLLTFWRDELVVYAERHGLDWRTDPSNADLRFARNRIRTRILPELEAEIAPAARRNLVALAALAAEAEGALQRLARQAERDLLRADGDDLVLARDRLQDYDSAVVTRVVRRALRRLGSVPGRAGTRAALQFITHARSGAETRLPGGVRIAAEFGEARISRLPDDGDGTLEQPVGVGRDDRGDLGPLRVGGATYRIIACDSIAECEDAAGGAIGWIAAIDAERSEFPLRLRGWRPGDRVATAAGTKSLKKLFLEERIPRSRRARLPVLEDAQGRVLWVAGVDRPLLAAPRQGARSFFLKIVE